MTHVSAQPVGSTIPPRYVRALKIAVAVLTALMIAGIVALVYGVARQVSKLGSTAKPAVTSAAHAPYTQQLDLGPGKLESVTGGGDVLVLHWKNETGDTVLSIDPRNGRELGRIQLPRH
ncbi:MAG: hypothetical protein WA265_17105 [Rhodomicrobium sp.]